jgi:hypothetical protein
LVLHRIGTGGGVVAEVAEGWSEGPEVSVVQEATTLSGAFGLASGSRDIAFVTELSSGSYTAEVDNEAGGKGYSLVEVYSLEEETGTAGRLVNVSIRGMAGFGNDVLIGGFVVGGTQNKRVLVRAAGPAIAGVVPGAIADPRLAVFREQTDETRPVAENDDWEATPELVAAATRVGAFDFEPGSADAAVLLDLEPGVYTAVVGPGSGQAGAVLLEVYEVNEP